MKAEDRQKIDRSLLRTYPEIKELIKGREDEDMKEEIEEEEKRAKSAQRTSLDPPEPRRTPRTSLDPPVSR